MAIPIIAGAISAAGTAIGAIASLFSKGGGAAKKIISGAKRASPKGPGGWPASMVTPKKPDSPPDAGRSLLDRFNNAGWGIGNAKTLGGSAMDIFNFPSMAQSVDVQVHGGPKADMRRIHWLALAVAFGRLDLSSAKVLPFVISCNWSITTKQVAIHLEYSISFVAMAAAFAEGQGVNSGTAVTNLGINTDLKTGLSKIIGGPNSNAVGGKVPDWLKTLLNTQGVTEDQFPSYNTNGGATVLGFDFTLPEQDKLILQMDKYYIGPDALSGPGYNSKAINPQPIVDDGVRTSLLALVIAALSDPTDDQAKYPKRPQNYYNNITDKDFKKGNAPDTKQPPNYPNDPVINPQGGTG